VFGYSVCKKQEISGTLAELSGDSGEAFGVRDEANFRI
jgi:hypothetical protein